MVLVQKQTCGSMEQNGEPRNKPTHLWSVFDKGVKNIQWEKKNTVSSASHVGKVGQTCKSMKLEHTLTPYTKIK